MSDAIRFDLGIETAVNAGVRVTAVKTYLCPSDAAPPTWTATKYDAAGKPAGAVCDVASANFVGVFGVTEPGVGGEGMFFRGSAVKIADVTDGTSQTMMVGERCSTLAPAAWVGAVTGADIFPYNASNMVLGHVGEGATPAVPTEVNHFSSRHSGGTHFVFADGHVAFLTGSVNYAVYQALATRAGGDLVGGNS